MQTLPCFFRPSPFVSDTRIPDASEEITLPFNSHTLWNPWLQHNYCLFLLTISTDVLQSLSFIQFVPQIILTSSLFNQMSVLTLALFCCLALDAWLFLQIISTISRSLFSFLSSVTALSDFCSFWVDPHPHASSITSWADNSACILAFRSDIFVLLWFPFLPEITDPTGFYPSLLLSVSSKFICVGS